jgi:hypothetical protein
MGFSEKKRRPAVDPNALVVSVNGAGVLLNACRETVYDLIRGGQIDSFLDGRRRKVSVASIRSYIAHKLANADPSERARHPQPRRGE